jgi:hypothetical protein
MNKTVGLKKIYPGTVGEKLRIVRGNTVNKILVGRPTLFQRLIS